MMCSFAGTKQSEPRVIRARLISLLSSLIFFHKGPPVVTTHRIMLLCINSHVQTAILYNALRYLFRRHSFPFSSIVGIQRSGSTKQTQVTRLL
jgi:hypothetical protein